MEEIFKKLALLGDVWVLWLLVAASVGSLGVMIERGMAFLKNKVAFDMFLEGLTLRLSNNDLVGARQWVRSHSSVESRVVMAGLEHHMNGFLGMEKAMSAKLTLERAALEKNLIILGTLGNNAPFIGLFGTVLGIIKAFNDLSVTGSSGVSVVMSGISSALIATAFGIFVAIPAVAANNYFHTRLRRIAAHCHSLMDTMQSYIHEDAQRASRVMREKVSLS